MNLLVLACDAMAASSSTAQNGKSARDVVAFVAGLCAGKQQQNFTIYENCLNFDQKCVPHVSHSSNFSEGAFGVSIKRYASRPIGLNTYSKPVDRFPPPADTYSLTVALFVHEWFRH